MKIKKIFNYYEKSIKPGSHPGFLWGSGIEIPEFPEESGEYPISYDNFMDEYYNSMDSYDRSFARRYASTEYDSILSEPETENEYFKDLQKVFYDTLIMNFKNWNRLYYSLWLKYNPIWNVDGSTERSFSEHETTDSYGEKQTDFTKGQQIDTKGAEHSITKESTTAYDDGIPKEDARSETNDDAITNTSGNRFDSTTEGEHTDSHISGEHSETEVRSGNIGVTMTQQLLEAEWEFRKKSFWDLVFDTLAKEAGLFYKTI